jgi:hypothetical protein
VQPKEKIMLYIYKNITNKPVTVLLATKNQDSVGSRTMHPGATLPLDYPGLNMYVPNILSCLVIGDETSTHTPEVKIAESEEVLEPLVLEPIIPTEPAVPVEPVIPAEPISTIEPIISLESLEPINPVESESSAPTTVPSVVASKAPIAKTVKLKTPPKKVKK